MIESSHIPINTLVESAWPWTGIIEVIARFADGTEQRDVFHNLIVDSGRNYARDILVGRVTGTVNINYVALGSSNTAVSSSQTQLVSEQFRKAVTSFSAGSTGQGITTVYIATGEATAFTINEIGWFAQGTSTANSGTMIARVLYNLAKTPLESLQISRQDNF